MQVNSSERLPIKIWATDLEEGALEQAKNLAKLPFLFKWVSLMPDSHQGYGMPIGGVIATHGVIIPNAVGVDIGCGMIAIKTSLKNMDQETLKKIMGKVRDTIPVGFNHHKTAQDWEGFDCAPSIPIIQQELKSARKQIGTLGGGNHFQEFQQDDDGFLWVMIHSGSRNFGLKVAKEYHDKATKLCKRWHIQLPDRDLAYLPMEEQEGQDYYAAMSFCLDFAMASRAHMMDTIHRIVSEVAGGEELDRVNIHHNYASLEHHYGQDVWVHRKGATLAREGVRGIIPGSMGSSSYIVEGLSNPESFHSCSHGAGRKLGRKEAARSLNLDDEKAKMEGILHGLRHVSDLDEAPGAYKDIDTVMENQKDLVKILTKLKPLGSIKG